MAETYAIGVSFSVRVVEVNNGYIFLAAQRSVFLIGIEGEMVDEEKIVTDDEVQDILMEDTN